jgi:membrane carboxypeptidase/penicillin-binding protein
MSVDVEHPPSGTDPSAWDPSAPIPFKPPRRRRRRRDRERPPKPRVRKLRLLGILVGLGTLAVISTVFGMMMAVASDIPQVENWRQYKVDLANSFLYDDHGQPLGIFAPPDGVVIDKFPEISPWMRRAIVATEDRRFWTNPGVDIRGIARAFLSDIGGHSAPRRSPSSSSRTPWPSRTTARSSRSSARRHLRFTWPTSGRRRRSSPST